jgi:glycosyltransferase involved in cell wall biosynthesis
VKINRAAESSSRAAGDDSRIVSIIIPCFNQAHFLAEAIDSALNQSSPVEVIVVDDGSTDNTSELAARYEAVTLVRQANQGLSAARNAGWRAAHGRYVMFLDADDRLLPGAVETNLRMLEENPQAACAHGAYRRINAAGGIFGEPALNALAEDAFESFLGGNRIGMHATVMYRRDVLQKLGGFDTRMKACEDYELYLRLSRQHRIVSNAQVVAEYRDHTQSMSKNAPLMLRTVLRLLRTQKEYAAQRPRWAAAHAAGIRHVKELYVDMQIWQLCCHWDGRFRSAVQVFMLAPGTFLSAVICRIVARLRK